MNSIKPKNVFILGTAKRSGTNFLKNMLCIHEECFSPGPIWEDFLLEHVDQLDNYVAYTSNRWNPEWQVEEKLNSNNLLKEKIGAGLINFLRTQLETPAALEKGISPNNILVSKTPSTENLHSFFQYFPDAYLIIITRDGRAVAESASKSFNKPQTIAIKEWNLYSEKIIKTLNSNTINKSKVLTVKYENLYKNTELELEKIIDFLDIDKKRYNFALIKSAPIIGSSELSKKGNIHWEPIKKTDSFNPNNRWENWTKFQHSRFNWLAGKSHRQLGYELVDTKKLTLINSLLDLLWTPVFFIWYKVKKISYTKLK